MKLVHVVPQVSAEADGVGHMVRRLCQTQVSEGHQVTLACLDAKPLAGVQLELHAAWSILGKFGMSPKYARALSNTAWRVDVVHNHGLWSMVTMAAGWVVPGKHAKLVTSPHGTLSEWALSHHRWRKRAFWPLQKRVLERADLIHATCEQEYFDIRRLGLVAPVAIVPIGIDLPDTAERDMTRDCRELLFLSRVHPAKGVELLLDAWAAVETHFPNWRLKIAGPSERDYLAGLLAHAQRNGIRHIEFVGPLYGEEKFAAYQNADLFVLPTHSENFGVVVAEALAQECPAVVCRGAPWAGLEAEGCGWWIEHDVSALTEALIMSMGLSDEQRLTMGRKGRAWMQRGFGWKSVGQEMAKAYSWLVDGGPRPACIQVD